jgi:hypothetical protein
LRVGKNNQTHQWGNQRGINQYLNDSFRSIEEMLACG